MQSKHIKGTLIVLTGITASGKDTVKQRLLKHYPQMQKIVTTLSRLPREGERPGIDHYFISREEFLEKKQQGEFLETNEYTGNLYGTYKSEVKKILQGALVIWQIDPASAAQVSEIIKKGFDTQTANQILKRTLIIFIDIPDQSVSIKRMQQRGMSPEIIAIRVRKDQENLQYKPMFTNIVVNEDGHFEKTFQQLQRLIDSF